jgi:hypothetical protein
MKKRYPIGGPDADSKYILFEIHYNNPDLEIGMNAFLLNL